MFVTPRTPGESALPHALGDIRRFLENMIRAGTCIDTVVGVAVMSEDP